MEIGTDKKKLLSLVEKAQSGEIVLPQFQRNFVWTRDDLQDLLTSILKPGSQIYYKRKFN